MKNTTLTLTCLIIILLTGCKQPEEKATFRNPVIPEDFADATVIRWQDGYYATGSSSEWAPYYPLYTSDDLVNWNQVGYIFEKQPEWTLSSFWAPELFVYNNKVYVYYTARNKAGVSYIGVATANHPAGPYTDHGLIVEYGSEAIDAFVLEDGGELYISWKAYGLDERPIELLGAKLSRDGLRMEGEPFTIMVDDENIGMEGQHWMKKGDYYYMIYSTHSCCGPRSDYKVSVGRSKSLKGPYEKYTGNPILHANGKEFQAIGHGTVTTLRDGRMFYLSHAYLAGDGFYGGRQGYLSEMIIGDDNWPHFTTGNIAQIEQQVPFSGTIQKPIEAFKDDFSQSKLSPKWSWNYVYSEIKASTGNGKLVLSGTPIGDNKNGSALCIRPVVPDYSYETQVINKNNSLKGLTMYGDDANLVAFGSINDKLVLKQVKDGQETIISELPLPSSSPYLKIEVENGCRCTFLWSNDKINWQPMENATQIDYSYLVRWDRVARPGLIHSGAADEPAEFAYFETVNN